MKIIIEVRRGDGRARWQRAQSRQPAKAAAREPRTSRESGRRLWWDHVSAFRRVAAEWGSSDATRRGTPELHHKHSIGSCGTICLTDDHSPGLDGSDRVRSVKPADWRTTRRLCGSRWGWGESRPCFVEGYPSPMRAAHANALLLGGTLISRWQSAGTFSEARSAWTKTLFQSELRHATKGFDARKKNNGDL